MAICPSCEKEIRDDIWVCGSCGELVARGGATSGAGSAGTHAAAPTLATVGPTGTGMYAGASGDGGAGAGAYGGGSGYGGGGTSPGGFFGSGNGYAGGPPGGPVGSGYAAYGTPAPAPLPTSNGGSRSGAGSRAVLLAGVLGIVAVVAIVAVWFFVLRGGGGDFSAYLGEWQLTVPGSTAGLSLTIQDGDGRPQLLFGATGTSAGQTATQSAGPYKMELSDGSLVTKLEAADNATEDQKMAADAARAALGAVVDDFQMVLAPGGTAGTLSLTMEGDIQGSGLLSGGMDSQAMILTRASGSTSQTP